MLGFVVVAAAIVFWWWWCMCPLWNFSEKFMENVIKTVARTISSAWLGPMSQNSQLKFLSFKLLSVTLISFIPQFSCSVVSYSLWPHGLQHIRLPCPSPTPRAYSNSCALSQWCHPTISSSVVPFSSCLQSFPAPGSFPVSQFFASGGQSIRVAASISVLSMKIQDWSPLGWTGRISLHSKGLWRVFSNTTVQKHQSFGIQLSL